MAQSFQLLAQAEGAHTPAPAETHASTEAAHGGAHDSGHGGFPPFNAATFGSQVLWPAITFGLLYLLMSRLALPRIGSILEARQSRVTSDLAEAQRLKAETDEAIASYERSLLEARGKAQSIAASARDAMTAEADVRRKQTEADLATRLADAERQIAATKQQALGNVRGIAVEAAETIVARLLGRAPAQAELEAAVDAALKR